MFAQVVFTNRRQFLFEEMLFIRNSNQDVHVIADCFPRLELFLRRLNDGMAGKPGIV